VPKVSGVLETNLYVVDLERSLDFYQTIFGFEKLEEAPGRLIGLSVAGRQVLLLAKKGASTKPSVVPGGIIPPCDGTGQSHLAQNRRPKIAGPLHYSHPGNFSSPGRSILLDRREPT